MLWLWDGDPMHTVSGQKVASDELSPVWLFQQKPEAKLGHREVAGPALPPRGWRERGRQHTDSPGA